MHNVWQTFNVGSIQAIVVIACDENLVFVRQVAKPFDEVFDFLFGAVFSDVTSMNYDISFRHVIKKMMLSVSVRDM